VVGVSACRCGRHANQGRTGTAEASPRGALRGGVQETEWEKGSPGSWAGLQRGIEVNKNAGCGIGGSGEKKKGFVLPRGMVGSSGGGGHRTVGLSL